MDDVMDLYDRLPPTDMFSLEEMIERDMRSEHFESDGNCSQIQRHHFECGGDYDDENDSMTFTPSGGGHFQNGVRDDGLDSDLFYLDDDVRNELPWFNMTNSNNGNHDFDPRTVLVNPNTGLRAADESNRSDSGEEEPLFTPVKPSLVECDDSVKSVNNRHRLFIRNGGNYFKINEDVDSSETETSDDDEDEKQAELKYKVGPTKMTKPFSSTNHKSKTISNRPMVRLPLVLPSSGHAQLDGGPCATRVYPKPAYSYSCLIAIALKNSLTGNLPVSEIYSFMIKTFPYFETAPNGWKNSVRHNLSLNKCFEKIETGNHGSNQRKGCLWGLNPNKAVKMDEEVQKWNRKDPIAIRKSMARPETLELLEKGALKMDLTDEETRSMLSMVKVDPMGTAEEDDVDSEDDSDSEESLDAIEVN